MVKKPYYTSYPRSQWIWFRKSVYKVHKPHIGDVADEVFDRLTGGEEAGAAASYRTYRTEAEALADYERARHEDRPT
jgi:hypothetical protein